MGADAPRHVWTVAAVDAGSRLDHFLTQRKVLGTRSQVCRLIADGRVRIGDRAVKAGTALRAGDQIVAEPPTPPAVRAVAAPIALDVLFEDASVLAINKPPGMVVHPAPGHWQGTLVSALLHRWPEVPAGLDPSRLGIVHRLDKDTSGVLLIARTASALADLGDQFRRREISKDYLALVWGSPRPPRGVIDRPIGRHPVQRKKMAVQARGRVATTRYEVLEQLGRIALVRAHPETGRTHQIRVHLAAIGHPVVSDALYARGHPGQTDLIGRQALHAEAIAFRHPVTGERLRITAPLSADFAAALAALRGTSLTSQGPSHSVPPDSTAPRSSGSRSRPPRRRHPA
ncbi:MAG TPA: RluA family pseudouridine synthase [Candidatus Dormibacteraeota bacterium]|nr:RluA family pseudouridine synthase [Candidatus Dormibacteraeota bacterium]